MYSCTFSILWEIRPPAPTCQAFSCGYIRRSEGSPLGKYRGKRFICTYWWVGGVGGWGGGDRTKNKDVHTKVEFSDSLGDSEVVRVLGNAILHITKWAWFKRQQAVHSMQVDSQSLSASRSKRILRP